MSPIIPCCGDGREWLLAYCPAHFLRGFLGSIMFPVFSVCHGFVGFFCLMSLTRFWIRQQKQLLPRHLLWPLTLRHYLLEIRALRSLVLDLSAMSPVQRLRIQGMQLTMAEWVHLFQKVQQRTPPKWLVFDDSPAVMVETANLSLHQTFYLPKTWQLEACCH
jgi:hypothetical protein